MIQGILKLDGLNFEKVISQDLLQQNIEFNKLLQELLNLIVKTDNLSDSILKELQPYDNNFVIMPAVPVLNIQNQIVEFIDQFKQKTDNIEKLFDTIKFNTTDKEKLFDTIDQVNHIFNSIKLYDSEKVDINQLLITIKNIQNSDLVNIPKNSKELNIEQISKILQQLSNQINEVSANSDNNAKSSINQFLIQNNETDDNLDIMKLIQNISNDKKPLNAEISLLSQSAIETISSKNLEKDVPLENNRNTSYHNFAVNANVSKDIKTDVQKFELPVVKINELSDAIMKTFSNHNKTLIVQLEPPELGKILIKLSMDNFGIKADLKFDYPHVKEMITGLVPEIKSNLQSSGIKVSDFVLDLMKDQREYKDSHNQWQRRNRGNQSFIEYFA